MVTAILTFIAMVILTLILSFTLGIGGFIVSLVLCDILTASYVIFKIIKAFTK